MDSMYLRQSLSEHGEGSCFAKSLIAKITKYHNNVASVSARSVHPKTVVTLGCPYLIRFSLSLGASVVNRSHITF